MTKELELFKKWYDIEDFDGDIEIQNNVYERWNIYLDFPLRDDIAIKLLRHPTFLCVYFYQMSDMYYQFSFKILPHELEEWKEYVTSKGE